MVITINYAYQEFHPLTEEHFPNDLKGEWRSIYESITKYGPKLNYKGEVVVGSVENTMTRIRNKTGAKIANKIFNLFYELHHNEKYF